MKAYELYHIWANFESLMESSLPADSKLAMGKEWLAALPPRQLCVTSEQSYDIIKEAIKGRLSDLKASSEAVKETYGSAQGTTEDPQGKEQEPRSNVRQKPIRKAKQDA